MYVAHAVAQVACFDCHFFLHTMLAQQHKRLQVRCAAETKHCFVLVWGLALVALQRATSAERNPRNQDSSKACQQDQRTI